MKIRQETINCPYVMAIVTRSVMQQQPITVPAHELLLLTAMYTEEKIKIIGPAPDGAALETNERAEYERLARKYGDAGEDHNFQPWVGLVFGRRPEGRLREAMSDGLSLLQAPEEQSDTPPAAANPAKQQQRKPGPAAESSKARWPANYELIAALQDIGGEPPAKRTRANLEHALQANVEAQLDALGVERDESLGLPALFDLLAESKAQLQAA
jgi:hypothetical protein